MSATRPDPLLDDRAACGPLRILVLRSGEACGQEASSAALRRLVVPLRKNRVAELPHGRNFWGSEAAHQIARWPHNRPHCTMERQMDEGLLQLLFTVAAAVAAVVLLLGQSV